MSKVFLFCKDFTDQGNDRYFLWDDEVLSEKTAEEICNEANQLICHDYWLIAPSIVNATGRLPKNIVDIHEFSVAISGIKQSRKFRERSVILDFLKGIRESVEVDAEVTETNTISPYIDIFYRKMTLNPNIYGDVAKLIKTHWAELQNQAEKLGEHRRQIDIEIPIFNLLHRHITPGIRINSDNLRTHKNDIDYEYYKALKEFSSKYNLPLEIPNDETIIDYLETKGFDFSGISVDYILEFVPTPNGFAQSARRLRKIGASRHLLSALPISNKRSIPIIDTFGTITSRIYFKDPVFQNLKKKYRNIISPDNGKLLSYVDYDQFEVGIMAALSGDPILHQLYNEDDLYESLSVQIFRNRAKRKLAKRLFLSYAYGMKLKNIADAADAQGADRAKVKSFFRQLTVFEQWKTSIHKQFLEQGFVGTLEGNFLRRRMAGQLSQKEKRSCISQVVQGTASLIFKKALLEIDKNGGFRILLPMHDAVLVEHTPEQDTNILTTIFSNVMTNHFGGVIKGKSSLEQFFSSEK